MTKESGQTLFQKGSTFERGTYTFFDPETWEKAKREATIYYEQLEDRAPPPPIGASVGVNTSGAPPMGMGGVTLPGMTPMSMANNGALQQQQLGMRG